MTSEYELATFDKREFWLTKERLLANQENARVHIVLARHSQHSSPDMPPSMPDGGVPKIEHDGQWHTLH